MKRVLVAGIRGYQFAVRPLIGSSLRGASTPLWGGGFYRSPDRIGAHRVWRGARYRHEARVSDGVAGFRRPAA